MQRSASISRVRRLELPSEGADVRKPRALSGNSLVMPFAPASPAEPARIGAGIGELERLGFRVGELELLANEGYFAGSVADRQDRLVSALVRSDVGALVGTRGGYGSTYLLDDLNIPNPANPKIIWGYSDLTSLQIYLWQRFSWVTFYAPMLAAGLDAGADVPKGYDRGSLLAALQQIDGGWEIPLQGDVVSAGEASGRLLGGCLTLVETAIGTPWDLETDGAILVLEDRGMKPWQVDRALMHLRQAGKFLGVRGLVLGDFPECESPVAGSATVREVCQRILAPLGVPIIFGAPVGHTVRPMLTLPLGVNARLSADRQGLLEILEPAVVS
jgi:muramoyltetrapeptide carboxypeptidase